MTAAEDQRIIEALRAQLGEAYKEVDRLTEERDGAYMERARILAWHLAERMGPISHTMWSAVMAPAQDVGEPGWEILYVMSFQGQLSWHISPEQAKLFPFVEKVDNDDNRAQWDGHSTTEKYNRIHLMTMEAVNG